MSLKEATQKIGSSCTHWFGFSTRPKVQFMIPTQEKWDIMCQFYTNGREYEDLRREYEELRREYEELRREYEELRRPFFLAKRAKTDVLKFSQEAHITKAFDHDTKKPETLTRALIKTCSRPNDLIIVPFAGSGTECAMAAREKRRFIGFDVSAKSTKMTNDRADKHLQTLTLF